MAILSKTTFVLAFALLLSIHVSAQKTGDPYPDAGKLIEEGNALHEEKKYEEAAAKFLLVNSNDSAYSQAQYELSFAYQAMDEYGKAISVCRQGMSRNDAYYRDFIVNLSHGLDEGGHPDSALNVLSRGMAQFPYYSRFHYEKGLSYARNKRYKEALESYIECIKLNPFHSGSHLRIGIMAAEAQKPAMALMALQMYCMVNNNASNLGSVIDLMEEVSNNEYKTQTPMPEDLFAFASELEEVDEIIRSKAALSEKYKKKVDLNYYIVKQLQVLCEKLPEKVEHTNWALGFYTRIYKTTWNKNMFEGCILYTMQHLEAEPIKKEVKQNRKKIDDFVSWAHDDMVELRSNRTIEKNGQKIETKFWYDNSNVHEAIGLEDNTQQNHGEWIFFHPTGYKSAEGNFEHGKKEGKWLFYHPNGALEAIKHFKDDLLEGEFISYHPNGAVYEKAVYKKGEPEGVAYIYHPHGGPDNIITFKDGKQTGKKTIFTSDGLKDTEIEQVDGIGSGKYYNYHPNGVVSFEGTLQNNKLEGKAVYYHPNGGKKTTGQFLLGDRAGDWIWYWENGKVERTGSYEAGKQVGLWKSFWENGTLNSEEPFENNNLKGLSKSYDREGKLFSEFLYKDDKVESYKFFAKDGTIIHQAKSAGSKIMLRRYNDSRKMISEGMYEKTLFTGTWKYYYANGALESEVNFEKGEKNGIEKAYYKNGKPFYELFYRDGSREGFYQAWYKNGKVKAEGYYKDNNRHGLWNFYFANGAVDTREFYYADEVSGFTEEYYADGRYDGESEYRYGFFNNYYQKDSSGSVFNKTKLVNGNGSYQLLNLQKKPYYKAHYVYGKRDSAAVAYFASGKMKSAETYRHGNREGWGKHYYESGKLHYSGKYVEGEADSTWTYYYENGTISSIANYKNDEYEGPYRSFHENGKPELVRNFKAGEKDGEQFYYNPEGALLIKTLFEDGVLVAYTYLDQSGNLLPWIKVENETADIKTFFQNGNPALQYKIDHGYTQGKYELFYTSGKPFSVSNMVDFEYEGEAREYYPNGNLKELANYFYDERNGLFTEYYENGKIKTETYYLDGLRHGYRTEYDATGKITKKTRYRYDLEGD